MAEQAPENSRSEDTPIDWIGQTIGHYRVEREIGRGGMGRVFYAIDTELERPVALKIIHPHLSEDETIIARFRQEAKSAARLSHPGIVHIYEFGREETGPPYFVMEYVEGVTLKDYLRKRRSLKVREALRVTLSIVKALEYAHKQNVVHRDIKPANILITSEGSIKILDFGLARFLEIEQTEGAILGSPHYMSPEQGQGKPTDHRSDMYSLGVTLYHMLMGTVPFRAKAPLAIVAKHVQSPIPEPESLKAILEGRLLDVLRRMLAKTPEERFPNYGELRKALQRLLHTHLSDTAKIEPAEKSESTSSDSDSDASDSGPSSKPSYGPMVLTGELFANETPQESQAQQTDPPPEEEDNSYSTPDPWASDTSNWQLEADSSLSLAPEEKPLTRRKSWILGIAFFVLLAVGMVVFGFIAMMPGGKSGSYSGITPGQNGGVVTPGPTPAPPAMTTETIDTAMGVDDPTTPTLTLLPERLPASQTEAWLDTKNHLVQNIASGTGAYLGSSPKNIASALMAMDYDSVRVEVQEIYHKIDGLPDSPERTLIYERLGQIEQVADTL
ncbi:MAG: serine/threonine protein kinase, partial [Candidatus Sumerlaeota bacterium]